MARETALSCKTAYTTGTTEPGLLVAFKLHVTSPVSLVFIYTSTSQAWKIYLMSYTWPTVHFSLTFNSSSTIHNLTQCVSCILMIIYAFQKAWNNTENRYIQVLKNIIWKVHFVTSYLLESWGRQKGLPSQSPTPYALMTYILYLLLFKYKKTLPKFLLQQMKEISISQKYNLIL